MWRVSHPLPLRTRARSRLPPALRAPHCMQVDETDVATCRQLQLEEMEVIEVRLCSLVNIAEAHTRPLVDIPRLFL
jgi:hypothetical protein